MSRKRTAEDLVHRFEHHDLTGAVIRILDDDPHSLNELVTEEHQQEPDRMLDFSYTCCYVNHRDRHIMIDGGLDGDEVGGQLKSLGVEPSDIELVLITHVDRDHAAGLILQVGEGELAYPNARYAIDAGLWSELHRDETYHELPNHLKQLFRALVAQLEDRVILCDGETQVADGITSIPCPGHRPGHTAYEFASARGAGAEPLIHIGDAFLNPFFIEHADWPVTGDTLPAQAVASRRMLIERLNTSSALAIATHFPWPGIGQILADGDAAEWLAG